MNTELETKRLVLRQVKLSDAQTLFSYWSDPEVTKFMNIEPFQSLAQVEEMIAYLNELAEKEQAMRYTLLLKKTNQIIGTCGFNDVNFAHNRAEIAYELGRDFWRKGYASEAIPTLLDYGFHDLDVNRMEAKVEPQNVKSIKLLYKLDFTFEGTLRQYEKVNGTFIDLNMYSKLRDE
ncbi:GNAT family protein [Bacillus tianshenii]|nr:GNAT family protein [Bacillus tianshenii]